MRYAIIDLGTNTFNLLVAEKGPDNSISLIDEVKLPVKLGEGGITKKLITPEAWKRGIDAIKKHIDTARNYKSEKILAFATSATRNASNGIDFTNEILDRFGVKVNIIDGQSEAEYIYYGVRQVVKMSDKIHLIMDIGGGSNELILADSKKIYWMHSFDLGVSRLLHTFLPSDPITLNEITRIENYFNQALKPFFEQIEIYKPQILIGSSGSFDTYRSMLTYEGAINKSKNHSAELPVEKYFQLHERFILSKKEERLGMKGLEPMRVDFIVMASLFTNFILRKTEIKQMYQSDFALKEGALWKILYQ